MRMALLNSGRIRISYIPRLYGINVRINSLRSLGHVPEFARDKTQPHSTLTNFFYLCGTISCDLQ